MKYKVGDEVFVRCKIINVCPGSTVPYEVISTNCNPGFAKPLYIAVGDDAIEDMTADEAWEIAKELFADYSNVELDEIFGKGWSFLKLMELTPHEAKARIEAWKVENEIKVGDEVAPKRDPNSNECKFVVTIKDDEDGIISGFSVFNGGVFSGRDIEMYQKTGRHIDIECLIKQIGGDE